MAERLLRKEKTPITKESLAAKREEVERLLLDGKTRAEVIDDIAETFRKDLPREAHGQATVMTEDALNEWTARQGARRSQFLDHEPLAGLESVNARTTLIAYLVDSIERIAGATTMGPGHHRIHTLIDMLVSPRNKEFARQVLDTETGKTRNRLDGWLGAVYDWQLNKLSLAVLPNLS